MGQTKILNKEILNEAHKRKPVNEKVETDLLIDLSHTIEHGLVTYKGLPAPIICDYLSRENSKNFMQKELNFKSEKLKW